jgi:hypothetical protein
LAKDTRRGRVTTQRRTARSSGASVGERPVNSAVPGRPFNSRAGVLKPASFLRSSFLRKIAAAALATAAAGFLYRKSDRSTESDDQGVAAEAKGSPAAPPARPSARRVATKAPAARTAERSAEFALVGDPTSPGPVRTRKKRSDAGMKRPRKPAATTVPVAVEGEFVPVVQSTDTSVIALNAPAGAPAQLEGSPSELEAEAHPS